MEMPNQERIGKLGEKENYKYTDTIKPAEMKEKITKKYLR